MSNRSFPRQRGASLLFIFLTTFIAMFFMGSLVFHQEDPQAATPPSQSNDKNSIKIFLVLVDDLNTLSPAIDSLWTISIDANLNGIFFLETSNAGNWDDLQASFSIQEDLALSSNFLSEAEKIIPDHNGYIILDRLGANTVLTANPPEQLLVQNRSVINTAQIQNFCDQLNDPEQVLYLHLGDMIEERHAAVNLNPMVYAKIIDLFSLPQDHRFCSIRSAEIR